MTVFPKAQKATGSTRNQSVDLMKLILSVFVVLIHTEVDCGLFTPFLRTAVPLFFITSGYFFFQKIQTCETPGQRQGILFKFLKRNLILYGFWFLVLLPVTLRARQWFSGSLAEGMILFLKSLLFNSTFRASWYLMALNIGVCLVYLLSFGISARMLTILTLPVYLLCCLFTNYKVLAEGNEAVMAAYNAYMSVFRSFCNSFPASLFWLALGRWFAEKQWRADERKEWILLASSAVLLILEHNVVSSLGLQRGNDAYLFLIPLCPVVFQKVIRCNIRKTLVPRMGHISTILYTTHASVAMVISYCLRALPLMKAPLIQWVCFALTMGLCLMICSAIFYLEKKQSFRWLRYAY